MLFQACALTGLLAITAASPAPVTPVRRQAASLCEQYGYYAANGYEFNNNNWGKGSGSGSQCTTVQSTSSSSVSWSTQWQWSGGQDNVKSYANAGKQFARGIKVSNVKSLPTNIQWDYQPRDGVRANVAYDVFTAADPNHDKSSGDYELMVWLARMGNVYPIGNKVTTVTLAGYSWDLYVGPNGSMKVFSFIPSDGSWKFSFNADLKLFFNYLAQNQGYPINNQHLIVFQQGTEPFTGGPTKYTVSSYSASVNQ